jgi:hypothetical protein
MTVSTHTEPHENFYAKDISCLEALSVCQKHTRVLEDGTVSMNDDMNLAGIPWLQKTTAAGIRTISQKPICKVSQWPECMWDICVEDLIGRSSDKASTIMGNSQRVSAIVGPSTHAVEIRSR